MSAAPEFHPIPVTLERARVRLEPQSIAHANDLAATGDEAEIWAFMPIAPGVVRDDPRGWIESARADAVDGSQIPFAIIDRESGAGGEFDAIPEYPSPTSLVGDRIHLAGGECPADAFAILSTTASSIRIGRKSESNSITD